MLTYKLCTMMATNFSIKNRDRLRKPSKLPLELFFSLPVAVCPPIISANVTLSMRIKKEIQSISFTEKKKQTIEGPHHITTAIIPKNYAFVVIASVRYVWLIINCCFPGQPPHSRRSRSSLIICCCTIHGRPAQISNEYILTLHSFHFHWSSQLY